MTLFLLGKCITARCSAETGPAECLPRPSVCMDCSGSDRAPKVRSARTPSAAVSWGKRSSWGGGKAPAAGGKADAGLDPRSLRAGFFPSWPTKPRAGAGGGAAMSPSPRRSSLHGRIPSRGSPAIPQRGAIPVPAPTATHSLVSRVMMMRMGLLFIPPTQLLLHMKLYRMVVNSVPTCPGGESRR